MHHPLLDLLTNAAEGRFPAVDGGVTVLPPLAGGWECSVAFTGHAVVATARSPDEVLRQGPDGFLYLAIDPIGNPAPETPIVRLVPVQGDVLPPTTAGR